MFEGVATALGTLLLVIAILFLTYYFTKHIGKGMIVKNKSRYMEIIDQLPVGQDKSVALIWTGKEYLLIGVTASGINVLEKMEEKPEPFADDQNTGGASGYAVAFKDVLEQMKKKRGNGNG